MTVETAHDQFKRLLEAEMTRVAAEINDALYNSSPMFWQQSTKPAMGPWPDRWSDKPDFTTALCEGWVPRDDGLQCAISRQEERLRKVLEDLAREWGVDVHYDCEQWG